MFSISVTLKSQTITDAEGNIYNTIAIGTQLWMKENLKTTKYSDGSNIPNVTLNSTWDTITSGAYCNYNNTPSNSDTYGRIYNGYTVLDSRGLCPTGWHVPSENDWAIFETYLTTNSYNYDGTSTPPYKLAKALASPSIWSSSAVVGTPGNTDYPAIRNISGFSALPSGWRFATGMYNGMSYNCSWWSSTFSGSVTSSRGISYNDPLLNPYTYGVGVGLSVRCICDLPVGINDIEKSHNILIYPNPTMDYVIIEGLENENTIEIINLQGQIVKNENVSTLKTTIDISALSIGIYTVKIKSTKGIHVEKLIKQ